VRIHIIFFFIISECICNDFASIGLVSSWFAIRSGSGRVAMDSRR
jgi:hypothetical protein